MISPWIFVGLSILFVFVGLAFVLRAQGYPNGIKVKPKTALWMFILFEVLAITSFLYAVL